MVTRISGLSSGMDIDALVKSLMDANRIPLTKLQQKKQLLEWQRDDYRAMNTKILEVRNTAFDMQLSSAYSSRKATSSDTGAFSVNATSSATEGVYTFEVAKLAKAASLTSTGKLGVANSAAKLGAVDATAFGETDQTTFTLQGEKGSATFIVKGSQTVDEFVKMVNGQSSYTGVKASYDPALDSLFFVSSKTGDQSDFSISSEDSDFVSKVLKMGTPPSPAPTGRKYTGSGATFADGTKLIDGTLTESQTFRITYDGEEYNFDIDKNTSVGTLINKINNSELGRLGVSAHLDSSGNFTIMDSGNKPIAFTDETDGGVNIVSKLGLSTTVGVDYSINKIEGFGQDAKVLYNNIEATFSTNSFQLNGLDITILKETTSQQKITVNQDTDKVFNNIKSFVDKYNEMIDLVNKELTEKKYRDFQPLTPEQREGMDEKDIELWEEKAKSGMLNGDRLLTGTVSNMRNWMSSGVEGLPSGDLKQLAEIGITTGTWSERGKLHIDEAKLKKAIAENPDQVMAMFTATDGVKGASAKDGIAVRIYQQADTVIEQLRTKAGTVTSGNNTFDIGKELDRIDKDLDNWNRRLQMMEDRYYKQFTAMENALNQMNSQSAYLMQQFGAGA